MGKRISDPFVLETDPLWKLILCHNFLLPSNGDAIHLQEVLQNHVCWISVLCLSHDRPLLLPARYLNWVTKNHSRTWFNQSHRFSGFSTEDTSIWIDNDLKLTSRRSHSGNTRLFRPSKNLPTTRAAIFVMQLSPTIREKLSTSNFEELWSHWQRSEQNTNQGISR